MTNTENTTTTTRRLMCDWCTNTLATYLITIDGWTDQACTAHRYSWFVPIPAGAIITTIEEG